MAYPAVGVLLMSGYAERPESAVLRTEMESGPAKQAQVRSKVSVVRPVTYAYTASEYAGFKTWFRDTIGRGASWFSWDDPVDGVTKQARIISAPGQPPYDAVPYAETPGKPLSWEVSMQLETLE